MWEYELCTGVFYRVFGRDLMLGVSGKQTLPSVLLITEITIISYHALVHKFGYVRKNARGLFTRGLYSRVKSHTTHALLLPGVFRVLTIWRSKVI